jgi:hypothetical protein
MIRDIFANSIAVALGYLTLGLYIIERVNSGTSTAPEWLMVACAGWWFFAAAMVAVDAAVRLVKRA